MERKGNKIKIFIGLIVLLFLAFGNYFKSDEKEEVVTKEKEAQKTVIIGLPGISNQTLEATGVALNKSYIEEELEKTVKDLEGKKVIYGKGTVQQKFFKEILKRYNLNEEKFISINAIGADAQSIFSAKEADALFTFYYITLFMESKGMGKVIDSTVDKPEISTQSLVVGRTKFLQENEEVPVAIIKALERAKEFAKNNPDEVFEIFAKSNIPAEIFKKAYSNDLTFSNFDPKITDESREKMQKLIDFLNDNQLVKNRIEVDDIFTNEYYEKAKKIK